MRNRLRLLSVLAHPDDASLGSGGILAKYAAEGLETYLVTATRGERGWSDRGNDPGPKAVGRIREGMQVWPTRRVTKLDYVAPTDGDLFTRLR